MQMTGGCNGLGAKLANIFSTKFTVETSDGRRKYRQVFSNNMRDTHVPEVTASISTRSWTRISFQPDLQKFGVTRLDDDIVSIMRKRTYDMAGLFGKDVNVSFNGFMLPVHTFEDYVDLFLGERTAGPPTRVHFKPNDRWEIVVARSDGEFQQVKSDSTIDLEWIEGMMWQMSFVNSICTMKGGSHVNHIVDQVSDALAERIARKTDTTLRAPHVKNYLHVFINCKIENPAFDSQTKEHLASRVAKFGSRCALSDEFVDAVARCGVEDLLVSFTQSTQPLKKSDDTASPRIKSKQSSFMYKTSNVFVVCSSKT